MLLAGVHHSASVRMFAIAIRQPKGSSKMSDLISGVRIPDSKIAREAAELVRQYETEMLFNHSVRVFAFGAIKGVRQKLKFDAELLYVAALFHDLGLVEAYHTETKRFEVDGADAAREFLWSRGIPEPKADLVWEAIALHTTPGIPQYMRPEIALTNAGVLVDVVGIGYDEYTPEQRDQIIAAFPRGDFKNEFIRVQTCSALKKPHTTFGTVNVDYIQDSDPTFHKPNACTRIRNTPWLT
jgi:HD domain